MPFWIVFETQDDVQKKNSMEKVPINIAYREEISKIKLKTLNKNY
jgi:hypothetical protein